MSEALFNTRDYLSVDAAQVEELKLRAASAPRRRFRLCLHRSTEDQVQEMVIAFCRDSEVPVHRHVGRSESFHVIEGELTVLLFDDDGRETGRLELGQPGSGKPFLYRLCAPLWHAVVPRTEFVVLHETGCGPFDGAPEPAPAWAATLRR